MSLIDAIKGGLSTKKPTKPKRTEAPPQQAVDERKKGSRIAGGRREGENSNPYLNARRTWNDHVGGVVASRFMWQMLGLSALLIVLAAVGGVIYIGSQSKFVPTLVVVDDLGRYMWAGTVDRASPVPKKQIAKAVEDWLHDARLVTPDVALQRRAVFNVYAMLSGNQPATAKMNEHLNGGEDSSPFKRAAIEAVSTADYTVLPQTPDTWLVEWVETVRDRQGVLKGKPFRMRALVTVYIATPTQDTKEEQVRQNPLGLFVRDFSWSKQL